MKLTSKFLKSISIYGEGKSAARVFARRKKNELETLARNEADKVYPGVKKGHKKFEEKKEFIQNRVLAYSSPRQKEIVKVRKALNEYLVQSAVSGRTR